MDVFLRLWVCAFLLACPFITTGQTKFQKSYDVNQLDLIESTVPTADGGFIMAGWHMVLSFPPQQIGVLIKTDSAGNVLWAKTYDSGDFTRFTQVQQTSDNGYVVVGENVPSILFNADNDVFLMKTDAQGNVQWSRTYGGSDNDGGLFVRQTSDNGFIIAGYTHSFTSKDSANIYIVKTNASGNMVWGRVFQFSALDDDYGNSVVEVSNGYVLAGQTTQISGSDTTQDIVVLKTNFNGNLQWAKTYGDLADSEVGNSITLDNSGNLLVAGYTDKTASGLDASDHFIMRLNSNGNILWSAAYDVGDADICYNAEQTSDGGYALFGTTLRLTGFTFLDMCLVKTDNLGNIQWSRIYTRATNHNFLREGHQANDGGYIMGAWAQNQSATFQDYLLVKTDASGVSGCFEQSQPASVKSYTPTLVNETIVPVSGGSTSTVTTTATTVNPGITVACEVTPCRADAGPDKTLCRGASVTIGGSPTAEGGTGPYTYQWSPATGLNATTVANPVASPTVTTTYTVTITDADLCTSTDMVTVTVVAPPAANAGPDQSICQGSGITIGGSPTASGGGGGYTYTWSPPGGLSNPSAANPVASPNGNTTYTVLVTDVNGCTASDNVLVQVNPNPVADAGNDQTVCQGNAVVIGGNPTASGGALPYSYNWTPSAGLSATNISNPAANPTSNTTYTVTVTDNNGCTSTASVNVSVASPPVADAGNPVTVCSGATITLGGNPTASGGTPPYTYTWTPAIGLNASNIANPVANPVSTTTYTVLVTDANNCTASASVTITIPAPFNISATVTDVTCAGGSNGIIDLSVSGGTPGYTYLWSNAATTQDLTGLNAGTYTVTVLDNNGCTITHSVNVNEPPPITINSVVNPVNCNGAATGGIQLQVTGGIPGYTYQWSNSASTSQISGLAAGSYSVTVIDMNNCVQSATYTVTEPPPINISFSTSPVDCHGNANGAIDATVSGGVPGYSYNWSNSATTEDISALPAGNYQLTVTDAAGCTATGSTTIIQPDSMAINAVISHISCNGYQDGSIALTVTGGTQPYTYQWSNGPGTPAISNLNAGTYTVTVTDNSGCTATFSATLTEPAPLIVNASVNHVSCNGFNDGSITLTGGGGTPPYQFNWSNGTTGQNLTNAAAGTYSVTVSDANGCASTLTRTVNEPGPITLSLNTSPVRCPGGNDGFIDVSVNGGVPPYQFLWSNSATLEDLSGLTAGIYQVTVTDDNGCTVAGTGSVSQPSTFSISAVVTGIDCSGNPAGSIDLTVSGGSPPYQFLWSNMATSEDLFNLPPGTYSVTVTDSNLCNVSDTFVLDAPVPMSLNVQVNHVKCHGDSDGTIDITVNGGNPPYTYIWSSGSTVEDLVNIPAGQYTVTVTDSRGCSDSTSITLNQPASPLNINLASTPINCHGDSTGAIDATITGGTPGYSYIWSNGATVEDPDNLPAGLYVLTVTDANGCTQTASRTVTQNPEIRVEATITPVSCFGTADGAIAIQITGGKPGYFIQWSTGSNQPAIHNLTAGTYHVTVTDTLGCTGRDSFMITNPLPLSADAGDDDTITIGESISLSGSATGGTGGYSYLWQPETGIDNPGMANANASPLTSTTYVLQVEDANGCVAYDTLHITVQNTTFAIPDVFTPNGDNLHDDFFVILQNSAVKVLEFKVFNRWGKLLHNAPAPWNGYYEGQLQPMDNYVYYFILQLPNGQKFPVTGDFVLLR